MRESGTDEATALAGLAASLDEVVPSAPLAARSLAIARELDHPVHGCFYLALAERREARLVTGGCAARRAPRDNVLGGTSDDPAEQSGEPLRPARFAFETVAPYHC